jgi:hypothetical protein
MGTVLLISGGVTLAKYLRQFPTSENDSPAWWIIITRAELCRHGKCEMSS